MATLAEASVRIRPDTRAFGGELKGQVEKDAAAAGKSAGKHVGAGFHAGLGSALAAAGIAVLLKGAVDEAVTFVESASKVKRIFKDNADSIKEFGEQAASSMGQSTVQVLDAAAKFGIFGVAANLTGAHLATFSTKLVSLATDLASFSNTTPQAAIDALGSALAGQARPMRAYGVLIDKASVMAEALGTGLVKATGDTDKIALAQDRATLSARKYQEALHKYGPESKQAEQAMINQEAALVRLGKAEGGHIAPLTQEQRILATQSLILKQTTVQQGDFNRTKGTAANQSRVLTAETKNLQEAIGLGLLPVLVHVQRAALSVIDAYKQHSKTLGIGTAVVFGFAAALWGINAAMGAWETLQTIANGLQLKSIALWLWYAAGLTYAAIAEAASTVGTWLLVASVVALDTAISVLFSPITAIIIGVALLAAGLIYAYKHSDRFRAIVDAVWKAIKIAVKATVDWLVNMAWPFIQKVWDGIAKGAIWLYRNVILPYFHYIMFVGKLLGTVLYDVFKVIAWVIMQIIVPAVRFMWEHVWGPILRAIGALAGWLWRNAIKPAFEGIAAVAVWLWHKFQVAFAAVEVVVRWLWEHVIRPVWNSITQHFAAAWDAIKHTFDAMMGFIRDTLVPAFKTSMGRIGDAWDSLKELAKKPVNFILGTVINKGIIDGLNALTGFFGKSAGLKHVPTLAHGGVIPGSPSTTDNTLAMVASGEYVMPTQRTRKYLPLLRRIHNDDVPGYALGGLVGALTDPIGFVKSRLHLDQVTRTFGDNVFVRTLVSAVQSVVGRVGDWVKGALGFGAAGPGGGGGAPDVGAPGGSSIAAILTIAKRFYSGAQVSSGYRPGDPGYHGKGLAADLIGGGVEGMDAMARGFYSMSGRLLELIHSPSWFVKDGRIVGADFYRSVFAEHFNHVHVAANASALNFDAGGTLKPGWNTVYNGTGGAERLVPAGGGGIAPGAIQLHVHGDLTSEVLPRVRSMLNDALSSIVVEVRRGQRR